MSNLTLAADRWRYLVTVGIWPKRARFDPSGWIRNFSAMEMPLALRLLEGFTYFSQELVEQMFRSTFLNISQQVVKDKTTYPTARQEWSSFLDSLLIVRVTGEIPSDADSGFAFARMARDLLDLPEEQIVSAEEALSTIVTNKCRNIVFVDDFVGSGNQFCETWERDYFVGGQFISFRDLSRQIAANFYYCPVICTETGKKAILDRCPGVIIVPAHLYGKAHSALTSESAIWRDDMRTEGPEFIRVASARAGIPDLGGNVGCWQGFNKLGLALAFQHGWPDATLPIFYSTASDWRPLLKKGVV